MSRFGKLFLKNVFNEVFSMHFNESKSWGPFQHLKWATILYKPFVCLYTNMQIQRGAFVGTSCKVADFKCITLVYWKTGGAVSC